MTTIIHYGSPSFTSIDSFLSCWNAEADKIEHLLNAIPENLWNKELVPGYRTLARLAWHIIQTPKETLNRTGLEISGPGEKDPVPKNPQEILKAHRLVHKAVADMIISKWDDQSLFVTDEMYGEVWTRSMTLTMIIHHAIHHLGQMTVLLRLAGVRVPSLYGPAKEDWAQLGMPEPVV